MYDRQRFPNSSPPRNPGIFRKPLDYVQLPHKPKAERRPMHAHVGRGSLGARFFSLAVWLVVIFVVVPALVKLLATVVVILAS